MSLVPSLTVSRKKRDILNGLRNTFTYFANLSVLLLALLYFNVIRYFFFKIMQKYQFNLMLNIKYF